MRTTTITTQTSRLHARDGAGIHRDRMRAAVAAAVTTAVLLSGCSGDLVASIADATGTRPETVEATPAPQPAPEGPAVAARADGDLAVYDDPGADTPARSLPATTGFGTPTVLLVAEVGTGHADGWLEVLLPVRPNGSTGWIRASDVELRDISVEVRVDLADRRLTVLDGGDEVLSAAAAIGDTDHPTPTGRFYVTDKLESPDPDGAYGPFALGLSAHSEVLTEFAGGDGQVGIHGTNAPDGIGRAVSHGCVRVDNAVVEQLTDILPLGTPVTIS